jgi:hypothetical protein
MSVDFLPQPLNAYSEDISTTTGTAMVSRPCQVWMIGVRADTVTAGVVSFFDDNATLVFAHKLDKAVIAAGQVTQNISYPHGLNCTRGLVVVCNVPGVDVFVSYD